MIIIMLSSYIFEYILKCAIFKNKILLIIFNINDEINVDDDINYINKIINLCKNNYKLYKKK